MSHEINLKPLVIALGTAFVTTLAITPVANAAENPFAMSDLSSGYMVAEKAEGKCGGDKMKEGKMKMDKEGKCGGDKMKEGKMKMDKEGKCGGDKMKEGKMKMDKEGKCGGSK